jgi:4-hydroxybenzoyl-CoA thioesterase
MTVATRRIEVEWGHCDPAGIVFNPRFFEWFDGATAGIFSHVGLTKPDLIARFGIVGFPLVETRARFLRPARHGDVVTIESRITEFRRSSFLVEHRLVDGGELAVEGFEVRVWTGRDPGEPKRLKSLPIPAEVMALFPGTPVVPR